MFLDVGAFSQEVTTEINQDAGATLPPLGDTTELKDEGIVNTSPEFSFGTCTC